MSQPEATPIGAATKAEVHQGGSGGQHRARLGSAGHPKGAAILQKAWGHAGDEYARLMSPPRGILEVKQARCIEPGTRFSVCRSMLGHRPILGVCCVAGVGTVPQHVLNYFARTELRRQHTLIVCSRLNHTTYRVNVFS